MSCAACAPPRSLAWPAPAACSRPKRCSELFAVCRRIFIWLISVSWEGLHSAPAAPSPQKREFVCMLLLSAGKVCNAHQWGALGNLELFQSCY